MKRTKRYSNIFILTDCFISKCRGLLILQKVVGEMLKLVKKLPIMNADNDIDQLAYFSFAF